MRHAHKVFYALLALCALAPPCMAQIQRDPPIKQQQPRQTAARVKRVTLAGAAPGVVILPKQLPLPRISSLAPLSKSALAAMFAGAGTQQVQSTSLVEYVRLSARQPYVEGKGSLVFSDAPLFNTTSDWVRVGSGFVYATFKPEPGKKYIIELGINGGSLGNDKQHPIKVAIGPGSIPFITAEKSAEEMLESGDHQLLFDYAPKNADPVVVVLRCDAGVIFYYLRIVSIQ